MKKLIAVLFAGLALAGCSTGVRPETTYVPTFCEVSEFTSPSGDRIYIYVGAKGAVEMRVVPGASEKVAEGK